MELAGWPASFWQRVCPPAWDSSNSYCLWAAGRPLNGSPRSWGGELDEVVVVLGHRAEEIAPVLAAYPVRWVINADYQTGMLSSVQCAVRAVDTEADYLICLGDQPRLSGAVVEQVLQARKQTDAGIIIPTANGKRGHPVLIRNAYRAEILGLPLDVGLNVVTRGHPEDTYELPVAEDAILTDMDTLADYQRELAHWPE